MKRSIKIIYQRCSKYLLKLPNKQKYEYPHELHSIQIVQIVNYLDEIIWMKDIRYLTVLWVRNPGIA